jgi:putative membrane protein
MKNLKSIVLPIIIVIAVMMSSSSCENNKSNDTKDTKEVAEEHNEAKFDRRDNEKDGQFLVNATEFHMAAISLGQLAQQRSNTKHVKELGKMMEDAHKKSLDDLTALAKRKSISIPISQTENGKDAYKKLNEKTGNDFGKEYSDMMVKSHKDAIALYEKASTDSTDSDIRAWATESLPALRKHLDQALICQTECDKL